MKVLVFLLALVGPAGAYFYDGVAGDLLPSTPACWGVCPGRADEDFAQCVVFTHAQPFQCMVVPRYHVEDPLPIPPGGFPFWSGTLVPQPCPPPQGMSVLIYQTPRRPFFQIDVGCWTP